MATDKYLNLNGLEHVADYIKERLKVVDVLPENANTGDIVLYNGEYEYLGPSHQLIPGCIYQYAEHVLQALGCKEKNDQGEFIDPLYYIPMNPVTGEPDRNEREVYIKNAEEEWEAVGTWQSYYLDLNRIIIQLDTERTCTVYHIPSEDIYVPLWINCNPIYRQGYAEEGQFLIQEMGSTPSWANIGYSPSQNALEIPINCLDYR